MNQVMGPRGRAEARERARGLELQDGQDPAGATGESVEANRFF